MDEQAGLLPFHDEVFSTVSFQLVAEDVALLGAAAAAAGGRRLPTRQEH